MVVVTVQGALHLLKDFQGQLRRRILTGRLPRLCLWQIPDLRRTCVSVLVPICIFFAVATKRHH
jgi:hypothetical protein